MLVILVCLFHAQACAAGAHPWNTVEPFPGKRYDTLADCQKAADAFNVGRGPTDRAVCQTANVTN